MEVIEKSRSRLKKLQQMQVLQLLQLLKYAFVLISVSSITQWLRIPIGNTVLWWLLNTFVFYVFWQLKPRWFSFRIPILDCWFILVAVNSVYGFSMAENYWDWKNLFTNIFVFLMPLAAYVFYKPARLKVVLGSWIDFIWILFIVLAAFMQSDAFGRMLIPFSFLAIFFPIANNRLRAFIIISVFITLVFGADSRSNVLKYIVCLLLGVMMRFKWIMRGLRHCFHLIRIIGFATPIVLLGLAATGTFNVFNIGEGTSMVRVTAEDEAGALDDTRTMLYVEELTSAIKYDYVWGGRSMARGYESAFFSEDMERAMKGTEHHYAERPSCEVSILNIFNYFGVVGIVFYFLIFWIAAGKALFHSRNVYVRAIGLVVIFRWIFAWIEDFSRFDLNMLFLWIMIGICFSPKWRKMTNKQVRKWVQAL